MHYFVSLWTLYPSFPSTENYAEETLKNFLKDVCLKYRKKINDSTIFEISEAWCEYETVRGLH